jgi:hypothetical protein
MELIKLTDKHKNFKLGFRYNLILNCGNHYFTPLALKELRDRTDAILQQSDNSECDKKCVSCKGSPVCEKAD